MPPSAPEFAILGSLEIRRGGELVDLRGGKPRALLLMLLLRANETVPSELLIDQLWGEERAPGGANALQVHISRLRRALGTPDLLVTVPGGYRLDVAPGTVDAAQFELELEVARTSLGAGLAQEAEAMLDQALARWRGPALADCAYHLFAQAEIARLEELRLTALEELMEAQLTQGRRPVAELERLVAEHPLRERLRAQLMLALHRSGRQPEALAAYRAGRDALMAELGLEPSPALRRLELDVLRHAPSLGGPSQRRPAAPAILAEAGARPLVGREEQLRCLRARLERGGPRVLLISGDAGSGKTRMLAELAAQAHATGTNVLYGRADDGNPIPFGPVVQALRGAALEALDGLEPELDVLATVAPELRARRTGSEPQAPTLCAALAALGGAVARSAPTLLVLDDLQWADRRTLQLLRHLALSTPLTILGALREGRPDAGLDAWIAELHASRLVFRLELDGLDERAARELVGGPRERTRELLYATGGNPFLLEELVRHRQAQSELPERVHALLERRLARLDRRAQAVLETAAEIGAEFGLDCLERVVGAGDDAVLGALERALAARLVEELDGDGVRYRFAPPLLRDALTARVGSARRARTQRRIAGIAQPQRRAA